MAENWLTALPPCARFVLQGDTAVRAAAGTAFGVALPETACRANAAGDRAALWLGPDEQLLVAPAADAESVAARIGSALAGMAHSFVDVSQRQLALQVSGPHAAAILNSGCPLDLDAAVFPIGACTRTLFGRADILLWRTGPDLFRVEVWRSFVPYVTGVLREAARDFLA